MPDQLKSASACIGCLTSAQYDSLIAIFSPVGPNMLAIFGPDKI